MMTTEQVAAAVRKAVAAEREACAAVAGNFAREWRAEDYADEADAAKIIEAEIRKRGP